MSNRDADDVLDFINSLPESNTNKPVPKAKLSESNDDFLEFLDELSAHEKTSKPSKTSKGKFEPRRVDNNVSTKQEVIEGVVELPKSSTPIPVQDTPPVIEDVHKVSDLDVVASSSIQDNASGDSEKSFAVNKNELENPNVNGEPAVDPIASISSWWNSEGSNKVSSLWGSLTSNAHQLSESTFQMASSTSHQLSQQRHKLLTENSRVADSEQILQITGKLNSILSTMSQQIRDGLIDKEDELMNILLVYDLNNVNYLDGLCASKFNKVLSQVEGGIKTTVSNFNHRHKQVTSNKYYDLGMFSGKSIDGEKLCFANLESSIKNYLQIVDLEKLLDSAGDLDGHEINKSNVFIAIQPITSGTIDEQASKEDQGPAFIEANNSDSFAFTMILKDITNNITIVSKSQPFPLRWARWVSGKHDDVDSVFGSGDDGDMVDPSEWVNDWIQDGIGLTFAVLAQEYVTRRMGI